MTTTDLPLKPTQCNCGAPVTLLLVKVQHLSSGKFKIGPFCEFSTTGPKGGRALNPDYRFFKWIGECAECFYKNPQEEIFK